MGWRANVCKIYSAFYLILIFFGGSPCNCTLPALMGPLLMPVGSKDQSCLAGSITLNLHHSHGMIF